MGKIIAIHQPNFFPWLGYFDKIVKSNLFIFLDHVQFPKKGGTWMNRVNLLVCGKAKWITASVDRNYTGTKKINEIKIKSNDNWKQKFLKTLEQSYNKHYFFDQTMVFLEPLILFDNENLSEYNLNSVKNILGYLELKNDHLKLSSTLNSSGSSTNLLVNLTKSLNGTGYLCGGGANDYQDDKIFKKNNLDLIYQNYNHPIYNQLNSEQFNHGLSIIDCLMNNGVEKTSEIIQNA